MELALYCPDYGYYEKEADTLGRRGDYYTSVSVGPLFGELLALQFTKWLDAMVQSPGLRQTEAAGPTSPGAGTTQPGSQLQLVEAGAHTGELARDILHWFREQRWDLFELLDYWIVEPSNRRQAWQRQTLAPFEQKVRWVKEMDQLQTHLDKGQTGVRGIIFSNELLDALPVHRLGWDATGRQWFEWGLSFEAGAFKWTRLASDSGVGSTAAPVPDWARQVQQPLPDGFIAEICPAASKWWKQAARALESGTLMTIDYGLTAAEWLAPERSHGTIRAYRRHSVASDVLSDPGEQDITAHVNFTTLVETGEAAGLRTEPLLTQEQFLTRLVAPVLEGRVPFGSWNAQRTRQFQTLTHPAHLGRAFRVLIQSR